MQDTGHSAWKLSEVPQVTCFFKHCTVGNRTVLVIGWPTTPCKPLGHFLAIIYGGKWRENSEGRRQRQRFDLQCRHGPDFSQWEHSIYP